MINISITDLAFITNASKVLKARNFMWFRDCIFSIDNFDCITYGVLNKGDWSASAFPTTNGLIMNQRELAKFTKSITTESSFAIDDDQRIKSNLITTISESMTVSTNIYIQNKVFEGMTKTAQVDAIMMQVAAQELDVSTAFADLYGMTKTAGAKKFQYDRDHALTMFGGILPLDKSAKLYLTIADNPNNNTFYARFRINKKIAEIYVYMQFIKI